MEKRLPTLQEVSKSLLHELIDLLRLEMNILLDRDRALSSRHLSLATSAPGVIYADFEEEVLLSIGLSKGDIYEL